jgi:hypothetical protein
VLTQAPNALVAPKTRRFRACLATPHVGSSESGRRAMSDYVDVAGASGRIYRFMRLKDGRPLSPMGGNYVFARHTGSRFEMIYAGEVQNLMKDALERWSEAVERFQVSEIYTRLNISERIRQLELADIVAADPPPMNAGLERKAG